MTDLVRLVGPNRAVEIFGVRFVGVNAESGKKLLFALLRGPESERLEFWTRQSAKLATALLLLLGTASIWFDDPTRLTTAPGLITAGLVFALQKVVTAGDHGIVGVPPLRIQGT